MTTTPAKTKAAAATSRRQRQAGKRPTRAIPLSRSPDSEPPPPKRASAAAHAAAPTPLEVLDYQRDFLERAILCWDVLRERANNMLAHERAGLPPLLDFRYEEKDLTSTVAGDADILLVPDLVSGNILTKDLEYLAGAVAAGVAVGLTVPVVLTSRADPAPARLASLALAALMHHGLRQPAAKPPVPEKSLQCAPQPEHACCPLPA